MGRFQAIALRVKKCNNCQGNCKEVYTSVRIVLYISLRVTRLRFLDRSLISRIGTPHGENKITQPTLRGVRQNFARA